MTLTQLNGISKEPVLRKRGINMFPRNYKWHNRHAIKGGQIKMFDLKRGYYFKKKEQKRDGHALRCKKYARFTDKTAGIRLGVC